MLAEEARAGRARRLDAASIPEHERGPYQERLAFEIDVIVRMGFPGYFLIVAEFIQWAKSQGIPVGPGRGSGAGSVVAWALTITDPDPLRLGLLFERSEEHTSELQPLMRISYAVFCLKKKKRMHQKR